MDRTNSVGQAGQRGDSRCCLLRGRVAPTSVRWARTVVVKRGAVVVKRGAVVVVCVGV